LETIVDLAIHPVHVQSVELHCYTITARKIWVKCTETCTRALTRISRLMTKMTRLHLQTHSYRWPVDVQILSYYLLTSMKRKTFSQVFCLNMNIRIQCTIIYNSMNQSCDRHNHLVRPVIKHAHVHRFIILLVFVKLRFI